MSSNFPILPCYQLVEQLYDGSRTLVYRGISESDRQSVIIKILRNPYPSFNELVGFRNQHAIARHLEHPTIVRPLTLERCGNGYALVMPDDGAIALSEYWQQSKRALSEFLNIALQLTEALQYLSQQRVIHKDIKPANILIHPQTRQVKLIDFSISSLLPKEQQQLTNPNILEGTLAYISPEQTGRMNRGIDYRTDFYSLGVTFFELLTGKLPFQTSDPMELVHCHLARMPSVLGNGQWVMGNGEQVPSVLLDIVMKLMAKNAEDRYQSALGLRHDLERCLQQWETTGEITPFELGERDVCDRFVIPEKLYGREKEVAQILAAFERVAWGAEERGSRGAGEQGSGGAGEEFRVRNSELLLVSEQLRRFHQRRYERYHRGQAQQHHDQNRGNIDA
ncbi:MAG: serine/threonine-protein kinase, partial [Cyanobacteriota bacterium]|nr:serine/threonine-protein kinase [Cyanobacteriota bacterium]